MELQKPMTPHSTKEAQQRNKQTIAASSTPLRRAQFLCGAIGFIVVNFILLIDMPQNRLSTVKDFLINFSSDILAVGAILLCAELVDENRGSGGSDQQHKAKQNHQKRNNANNNNLMMTHRQQQEEAKENVAVDVADEVRKKERQQYPQQQRYLDSTKSLTRMTTTGNMNMFTKDAEEEEVSRVPLQNGRRWYESISTQSVNKKKKKRVQT